MDAVFHPPFRDPVDAKVEEYVVLVNRLANTWRVFVLDNRSPRRTGTGVARYQGGSPSTTLYYITRAWLSEHDVHTLIINDYEACSPGVGCSRQVGLP